MQDTVAGHCDSEMMVFHLTVMLQLKHEIQIIALLHLNGYYITVLVEGIDRDSWIIHLLSKTGQMQTHDLIYATHRICGIALKSFIINGHCCPV